MMEVVRSVVDRRIVGFDGRRRALQAYKAMLVRRTDELVALVHRENGKPHGDALLEVVLIVEHLIPVLAPAVDRMVVLFEGRLIADGVPADVLNDEAVIDAYLGSAHQMEER